MNNSNENIFKDRYKLIFEKIDNILEKNEINSHELSWIIEDFDFFLKYQPELFSDSDKKKSKEFLRILPKLLEVHIENLINSQTNKESKRKEAEELFPFRILLQESTQQRFIHFLKNEQQFQPPTNYKFCFSIGLGLVVLFSLLIVRMMSSAVNKIKGQEK
ncbi:MAG: hypothetical protein mread185_000063 [Mycoplasmataceae bacterium]|nr:MAG: hypothetical protein mread185_000063 [Mycoplasmataceae bacterium]